MTAPMLTLPLGLPEALHANGPAALHAESS